MEKECSAGSQKENLLLQQQSMKGEHQIQKRCLEAVFATAESKKQYLEV